MLFTLGHIRRSTAHKHVCSSLKLRPLVAAEEKKYEVKKRRVLKGKSVPHYAAVEPQGKGLMVASEKPFVFTHVDGRAVEHSDPEPMEVEKAGGSKVASQPLTHDLCGWFLLFSLSLLFTLTSICSCLIYPSRMWEVSKSRTICVKESGALRPLNPEPAAKDRQKSWASSLLSACRCIKSLMQLRNKL